MRTLIGMIILIMNSLSLCSSIEEHLHRDMGLEITVVNVNVNVNVSEHGQIYVKEEAPRPPFPHHNDGPTDENEYPANEGSSCDDSKEKEDKEKLKNIAGSMLSTECRLLGVLSFYGPSFNSGIFPEEIDYPPKSPLTLA